MNRGTMFLALGAAVGIGAFAFAAHAKSGGKSVSTLARGTQYTFRFALDNPALQQNPDLCNLILQAAISYGVAGADCKRSTDGRSVTVRGEWRGPDGMPVSTLKSAIPPGAGARLESVTS
jgi:hypothetical protein